MKFSLPSLARLPWAHKRPARDARKAKLGEKRTEMQGNMAWKRETGRYTGDLVATPAFGMSRKKPELGVFGAKHGVDMRVATNRKQDKGLTKIPLDTKFNQGNDLFPFMAYKTSKKSQYQQDNLKPLDIVRGDLDATLKSDKPVEKPILFNAEKELETLSKLSLLDDKPIDAIEKIVSLENASREQLRQWNVERMVQIFGRKPGDTGSPEVQAAVFTVKIMHLSDHLHRNKIKDKLAVRKRDYFVHKRRKILLYLKRTNLERFVEACKALGVDPNSIVGSYRTKSVV